MDTNLPAAPVAGTTRVLPGPTSPDWDDPRVVAAIALGVDPADLPTKLDADLLDVVAGFPPTRADLLTTYGTTDPDLLRQVFALDVDVAAAERFAAEDRQVAA